MKQGLSQLIKNSKFQFFLIFAVGLFIFRAAFISYSNSLVLVISDLILILTLFFLSLNLLNLVKAKKSRPLSIVLHIGIINALIFFMIAISSTVMTFLFDDIKNNINDQGLFYLVIAFIYVFILLGFLTYLLLSFRELYFHKQSQDVGTYFNSMGVFFLLASVSALIPKELGLDFIEKTFFVVSVLLMIYNSLKISWIAFISKKEKLTLLVLSILIVLLFILNLSSAGDNDVHSRILSNFSPSLNNFFEIIMLYGSIYFSILFFTTLFHIPTAEVFDRKANEVTSLQYFSKLITQVLDFKELGETVTDITKKVCNAHASWMIWIENQNDMKIISTKNIGLVDANSCTEYLLKELPAEFSGSKVLSLKNFINSSNPEDKYSSAVISPIKTHDKLRGYLTAVKKGNAIFNEDDIEAINTFSDYASVAIENSILLEQSIEKERLEKELDVAREIQRKILPEKNPNLEGISISSVFIPAFEVGGDYYDFFKLDNNKIGFIIADVSGKGISAAFIMAEIKGIFESLCKTLSRPKEILINANEILLTTLDKKTFVSAAFGVLDLNQNTLHLARAGHCPLLMVRDGIATNLKPSGIALGISESDFFSETLEEISLDLKEQDILVLYTDGITEAKNSDLEDFGESKFENIILENSKCEPDEISSRVIQQVTLFSQSLAQYDDITLVIFKLNKN
jgi:serine phosphatase RsbU (regulator of sigma subunit)